VRIIAGEFRSRTILAPKTDATRPITDRVKQSLFDILSPMIDGSRVYDCFAGTGSMGLECLSRGAEHVTFFEADRSAMGLLNKNIDALRVRKRSSIISGDLFHWFRAGKIPEHKATIIFLDPPYKMVREDPASLAGLLQSFAADQLAEDGVVVFRHDANDSMPVEPLIVADKREYGGMAIELLRKTTPAE
jgi:16S rRNA (guanine966-N2)-methyltransferase